MSVDHDRITGAHEFITARRDALPTSLPIMIDAHDLITFVHARMTGVSPFDTNDHEFKTVSHEWVILGSVREKFDGSDKRLELRHEPPRHQLVGR